LEERYLRDRRVWRRDWFKMENGEFGGEIKIL